MVPVRDATPMDPTRPAQPTTPVPADQEMVHGLPDSPLRRRRRRHIWVDGADRTLVPGLIVEWRRAVDGGWEALVAVPGGRGGGALVQWRGAGAMRPLTDDGWPPQPR